MALRQVSINLPGRPQPLGVLLTLFPNTSMRNPSTSSVATILDTHTHTQVSCELGEVLPDPAHIAFEHENKFKPAEGV